MDAETGLERKKKLEANKLKIVRAYKKVFETEEGKEVLHDIVFTACKIDLPTQIGSDIGSIMFREGQRSIGLALLKVLDKDEESILKFIRGATIKNQLAVREVQDFIVGDS